MNFSRREFFTFPHRDSVRPSDMLFRMLFYVIQEYFSNRIAAVLDMPARIFLAYQGLLAFLLLMVINTGLVFGPVCKLSALSHTLFCAFVNDARGYTLPYATIFNSHSEVLTNAMEGTSVVEASSLDLTQAHIAIDDLVLLVDHSDITRKMDLAISLEILREETRIAGHHLQTFASNLGGTVERYVHSFIIFIAEVLSNRAGYCWRTDAFLRDWS